MNLNRATLIGNLTRDPETRTTPNGQTVSSFGVATSSTWKDASGQKQERVEFHNIVAWGKLAEICRQYLGKGRKVYVEGRLQTREWQGTDGVKKNRTEIVAENMIMLDKAPQGSAGGNAAWTPREAAAPYAKASPFAEATGDKSSHEPAMDMAATAAPAEEEIKVEDIPF